MVERTNLVLANKSESLRTTIPVSIVRQFGLSVKDQIEWNLEVIDNKMKIIITPIKQKNMSSKKNEKKRGSG